MSSWLKGIALYFYEIRPYLNRSGFARFFKLGAFRLQLKCWKAPTKKTVRLNDAEKKMKSKTNIWLLAFYICFGTIFLTVVYKSAKDAVREERSFSYMEMERRKIESTFSELCAHVQKQIECGPINWVGKNKPFGQINFETEVKSSDAGYFFYVLEKDGWIFLEKPQRGPFIYRRNNMELGLYSIDGIVKHITVTVRR